MAWYFRHDYKASADQKIVELEIEFGQDSGYARWFKLLEFMGEAGGTMPKDKIKTCAHFMRITIEEINKFLAFCIKIGLLDYDGSEYVNKRFLAECARIDNRSAAASANALARWEQEKGKDKKPKNAPKPAKEPPADTTPTADTIAIIKHIEHVLEPLKIAKPVRATNANITLTNKEIGALVTKYGIETVRKMCVVFYSWKYSCDKVIKSDYLSMLKPWVEERSNEIIDGKQQPAGNARNNQVIIKRGKPSPSKEW